MTFLICISIVFLVQDVTAVRHVKGDLSKPRLKISISKPANPAECFDLAAGAVLNVQSIKEHFGNKSFLISLAPGSADPSNEKALTTLYEAFLDDDCGNGAPWFVDVGAGS